MSHQSSPALLISSNPVYRCVIFAEEYCSSPISLQAQNHALHTPDVGSLSFLWMEKLASACSCSSAYFDDFAEFEISVFKRKSISPSTIDVNDNLNSDIDDSSSTCTDKKSISPSKNSQIMILLDTISQMKGLRDRLADASMSVKYEPEKGDLEIFLSRSEAIVHEFLSAIFQHRQRVHRLTMAESIKSGRKRQRGITSAATSIKCGEGNDESSYLDALSIRYFEALKTQLKQVDKLLLQDKFKRDKNNAGNRINLNENLRTVTILYHDDQSRCHDLMFELLPDFPVIAPVWTCDLPIEFEPKWTLLNRRQYASKEGTISKTTNKDLIQQPNNGALDTESSSSSSRNLDGLAAAFQEFSQIISSYQTLWNELDDIDNNLWVLEPSLPARRSCTERRLALRIGLSINITLDPERPRSVPYSMRLVGAGKDINDLRNTYQKYINVKICAQNRTQDNTDNYSSFTNETQQEQRWSEDITVRQNLELCFGFSLPSPTTTEKADYIAECGICYAHRLPLSDDVEEENAEDEQPSANIPNVTCGNPSCARSYHESCLFEWLHSLPTARVSFGRIFGTCPYCCESISVKSRSSIF